MNEKTWERRDHEPPERKLKKGTGKTRETNEETTIEKNWGWKLKAENEESSKMMAFGGTRNKNNSEKHRIARKGLLMIDNKWEDTRSWDDSLHKNGTRLRETLLRIASWEWWRGTTPRIAETLRNKEEWKVEPIWELIQIDLEEGIWLMKIILTS